MKAPKASGFTNLEGKGAQAKIGGKTVLLGNKRLMTENKIDLGELGAKSEALQGAGRTVVHLAVAGQTGRSDRHRPTRCGPLRSRRSRPCALGASRSSC